MLTIHHLNESRSHRVLWLAEELGLDYQIVHHTRDKMRAPASLRALHPLGKAPLIEDGGRIQAETGAIVARLARGSDLLPDPATAQGEAVEFWLHHAEGTAMPPLLMKLVLSAAPRNAPVLMRGMVEQVTSRIVDAYPQPEIALNLAFWEDALSGGWFAADRLTAADVMMSFPVEMTALRSDLPLGPNVSAWLAAIHARPAYQRALQKGGDYAGAKAGG